MPVQNISSQIPAPPQVGEIGGGTSTASSATGASNGTPQAAQANTGQPTQAQLKQALASINNAMLQANRTLQFSIDQHKPVVKVLDMQTGDVVTQIPSKVAMAIAQSINVSQNGFLINSKA